MIGRRVTRKLSEKEMQDYSGPSYYITHHEVLKPYSDSTPFRIVFNSSAKFNSHAPNEYWAKGPTLIKNLLGVLMRFREGNTAVIGVPRKCSIQLRYRYKTSILIDSCGGILKLTAPRILKS